MAARIIQRALIIFLLATSVQMMSGCSKSFYPEKSSVETVSNDKPGELAHFLAGDTGKVVDVKNVNPDQIIETARNYLGVPHCMGGTTSRCMDCSGLIYRVFLNHDIRLPHNAEEQARYGIIIENKDELKAGDLVFFTDSYNTSRYITHSGIYIGNNEFIHTSSNSGVSITSLDASWWKDKFVFGTRLF